MFHKSDLLLGWVQGPLATLHLGEGGTKGSVDTSAARRT